MTLRFNPGPDLERSFRSLCTSNRRSLNEQFRIILEAYLSDTNVPETQLKIPVPFEPQETVSVRTKPTRKLPNRKLTAADLVDLSDEEKWAVIRDENVKLSEDAIELLADFSSANEESDDNDFD
jgi:hypothetical protein